MIRRSFVQFVLAMFWCNVAWAQPATQTTAFAATPPGRLLNPLQLATERQYTSLSEAMVNPQAVYKLSLANQKLKAFPLEILMFPNLQVLNLSNNRIDSLPPEIGILANLQEINLMRNRLQKLPNEIIDLQNLRVIYLSRNQLYKFPHTIRGLQGLRFLDVSHNNLLTFELDWVRSVLPNAEVRF